MAEDRLGSQIRSRKADSLGLVWQLHGYQGPMLLPPCCSVILNMWLLLHNPLWLLEFQPSQCESSQQEGVKGEQELKDPCHLSFKKVFWKLPCIISTSISLARAYSHGHTNYTRSWEKSALLQAAMCLMKNPGSVTKGERIWVNNKYCGPHGEDCV